MQKLRVLCVHNYYQYPGGEDVVFAAEKSLLIEHDHAVFEYTDNNKRIDSMGKIDAAMQTIWSRSSYQAIKKILQNVRPDIAHFHNTFMLISPSVYYACSEMGIPVVQTLHNYRLICPNAYLFRNGANCEDCVSLKIPLPGIFHKCYRDSLAQSAVVASMLEYHRVIRTWQNKIDYYIALTEFSRRKFIQGGLPSEKIVVKPNYISDCGVGSYPGNYVAYAGRLSDGKGISSLLEAWRNLPTIPIKIIGEGPLQNAMQKYIHEYKINAEMIGHLSNKQVMEVIKKSAFLIFPSIWYETFGRTIIEAFVCGKPVIASNLPARAELIRDFETGLLYTPGDVASLTAKVQWLWDNPEACAKMGRNARREYEEKYSPERNYQMLMDIYVRAMAAKP